MTQVDTHSTNRDPSRWWPLADSDADMFVSVSSGVVHVRRAGTGSPLVLLHANGQSWHEFSDVIEPLAERFEVFAWDMPGHGESDPADPHSSIHHYAAILKEVLDALGLERVSLAGSSIGAFIAMAFDNQFPDRVAGLGLVEFQFITDPSRWTALWDHVERNFAVPAQSRDEIQARMCRQVDDELVTRWNVDRCRAGSRTMMSVMWAIRMFDAEASIRALSQVPIVVFGQRSPTIAGLEALEAALPDDARVTVVPDSGHFVAVDAPETLTAELTKLGPPA